MFKKSKKKLTLRKALKSTMINPQTGKTQLQNMEIKCSVLKFSSIARGSPKVNVSEKAKPYTDQKTILFSPSLNIATIWW